MAFALFGFVPGFVYSVIVMLGVLFGIRVPAVFFADALVASAWSAPVLYILVIGGSALSVVASLSLNNGPSAWNRRVRACGWSGFVLLLINVPLLLYQIVFMLTDD